MEESDLDFDSYWEEEARNPVRNRIRIGRQYQAQVPPLLANPELDSRKLSDLETLTYMPSRLSDEKLNEYLAIAKSIGLFVQAMDNCQEGVEVEELPKNLDELTTGWEIGGPTTGDNSPAGGDEPGERTERPPALLKREKKTARAKKASKSDSVNSEPDSVHHSPLKPYTNHKIQKTLQGLSSFIHAHRPQSESVECNSSQDSQLQNSVTPGAADSSDAINLGNSANLSSKQLLRLVQGSWSAEEATIFARALQVCGKNFSAIKKDHLPWKAVRAIIEFYYLSLDKENEKTGDEQSKKSKSPKNKSPGKHNRSSTDDSKRSRKHDGSGNSREHDGHDEHHRSEPNDCTEETPQLSDPTNSVAGTEKTDKTDKNDKNDKSESRSQLFTEPKLLTSGVSGQEVKSSRGKAIPSNDNGANGSSSSLGSLSLYLHGELVLKLNSQSQEGSGQKWVESSEQLPKKKRAISSSIANGNGNGTPNKSATGNSSSSVITMPNNSIYSLKRLAPDSRLSSRDDGDDLSSIGGGESDEDSRTSTESSSLIASSPSSSSTITTGNSSNKKARVRVENLSNGASPSTSRRQSQDEHFHKGSSGLKPLPGSNSLQSSLQLLGSLMEASENSTRSGSEAQLQTLISMAKNGKDPGNASGSNSTGSGPPAMDLTRGKGPSSFTDLPGFLSPQANSQAGNGGQHTPQGRQRTGTHSQPGQPGNCVPHSSPGRLGPGSNGFPPVMTTGSSPVNGRHYKKSKASSK